METLLNRQCIEMLHADSVKEFLRIGADFVRSIGFHTIAATVVTDHGSSLTEFQSITNAPLAYMPAFEDMASAKLDPVSQHCKQYSSAIVWDQSLYAAAGRGDFWEHQAAFGYLSGISLAFHLPHGRHFMFGIDSDQRVCAPRRELQPLLGDLREFAAHAQAAAFDLCLPYPRGSGVHQIPYSELDALRWSMDGLSDWEVGQSMAISETEVMLRIRRVIEKFGCRNKYEAGLRAIKLGLVHCD